MKIKNKINLTKMRIPKFLFLFFIMGNVLNAQRYEKNYRFSVFQSSFYQSYFDQNIFNDSCIISQFTPISDRQILFQFNLNSTQIFKGQMEYETDYQWMTCFRLNLPNLPILTSLCIKEMGVADANYIIFTNKQNDFVYGVVKNPIFNDFLYKRIRLYNKTELNLENCPFPGKY